jgi:hypothetical protein
MRAALAGCYGTHYRYKLMYAQLDSVYTLRMNASHFEICHFGSKSSGHALQGWNHVMRIRVYYG